jgi:ATP-binding protein involved in chromosome partitioning
MTKYDIATHIFFIASGKGGVGKSTVSVNLACALAKYGKKIGLLDADIYGPSIPVMMGLRRMSPHVEESADGRPLVTPFTKFGVKVASIGFFVEEGQGMLWRGPMLHGALEKMLRDIVWGELDILLIDLPPGTGDIPISLTQLLKVDGCFVVSTPQEVAMLDAIKAINTLDSLKVPALGIIENMAGFCPPGSDTVYQIFGEGKAQELSYRFNIPFLGSIPLDPAIRQGGDEGHPLAFDRSSNASTAPFHQIAQEILTALDPSHLNPVT